jgi:hypothetical protein
MVARELSSIIECGGEIIVAVRVLTRHENPPFHISQATLLETYTTKLCRWSKFREIPGAQEAAGEEVWKKWEHRYLELERNHKLRAKTSSWARALLCFS